MKESAFSKRRKMGSIVEFNDGKFRKFVSFQNGYVTYDDGHHKGYEENASEIVR